MFFRAAAFRGDAFAARFLGGEVEDDPSPAAVTSTARNLVIGLGSMPKQKNHPHPLFSKITG
jgi:hypothetical protein